MPEVEPLVGVAADDEAEVVPVTNCDVPQTAAFDQAGEAFQTEEGSSVRETLSEFPLKVATGDMAVRVATSVLAMAASTST